MIDEQNKQDLPRFFNPIELGHSLREVATDVIKTESQNVLSRWFHGAQEVDLFIWQDERKNVIKQQISFYGQVVEWNVIDGVKTGFILEMDDQGKTKGSEVIRYDGAVQASSLQQAIELLRNVTALSETEKQTLTKNFIEAPRMHTMDPGEFLRQFGSHSVKPSLSTWQAFWHKLKKLLS